jgi:hypothetical protein
MLFQCCVAANAPWPRPPKANEQCFVVSISTTRRLCGMSLQILHKSHDDDTCLPLPLTHISGLTKEDYDSRMQQIERRLAEWKGGYADTFLTTWAFLVIVLFIVAYMTPSFWLTSFHDHPFWIFLLMVGHVCGFYGLYRYIGSENRRLVDKIEHDLQLWHGIRVTMKRVACLPQATIPSGMYCFCVTLQTNDDGDAVTVAVSDVDEEEDEDEPCTPETAV